MTPLSAILQAERMPRLVRLGGTVMTRTRPNAIYLTFKVRECAAATAVDVERVCLACWRAVGHRA